jgi:tetratricopeptide (TPR) repeat protein
VYKIFLEIAFMTHSMFRNVFCAAFLLLQMNWSIAQVALPIIRTVPEDALLALLEKGKFGELSKKLQSLQSAYAAEDRTENDVHKAFYQFYRVDPKVGLSLDKWVALEPKDAMAHLARGMYRTRMGWASRGGKFARATKRSQLTKMSEWFAAAKTDFNLSMNIAPTLVETYCYLIEIDMTEGHKHTRELYEQALKINPNSFIAREFYLHSQLPRWGGSYEAMRMTVSNSKPFYGKSPRLEALEGREAADRGELAAYREDYQTALKQYSLAMSKGDFWFTNQSYGEALAATGNHAAAIEQFSRVISDKPGYSRAWWQRAISYKALRQFPEALADINYAIKIEPQDAETIAFRGSVYGVTGELELALKDFEMAAKIDPSDPDYPEFVLKAKNVISMAKTGR